MKQYTKWEKFYHKLNIWFHSIVAITMVPFAWAFLETQKGVQEKIFGEQISNGVTIAGMVSSILLIGLYFRLSRRGFRGIHQLEDYEERLKLYLKEKITLYLILEGAAFLALLGLYFTKEQLFTVIYLLVLFFFSLQRPAFDRVSRESGIPSKELKEWGSGPS